MKKAALILGICFLVVGVLTPLGTTLVTFMLPETFASSAKIADAANSPLPFVASAEKIVSRSSLDQVITHLNLGAEWGRKYKQPSELSAERCREILKGMIQINLPRNMPVLEIKVFSDSREEAAAIANKLAAVYLGTTPGATLIEQAERGLKPVRPNKRLNITLGIFVGVTLLVVGIGLLVASRIAVKQQ